MGYVSDWDQWGNAHKAALAAHPNCMRSMDCTAGANPDDHLIDCSLRHRAWRLSLCLPLVFFGYRIPERKLV